MLQGGPEFAAWRADRPRRERGRSDGDVVRVSRDGDTVVVVLDRPEVRNALSSQLRDQLLDAIELARADDSIRHVELRGTGPAFCAGGDLDEFGSFADPATAHRVRLEHSIGRGLAALGDRVVGYLHGACYGSGIELAAFAATVVADPDARFALPELALGLVPGAGGTVSITRRVGRHRTAWLGLTGRAIDAPTALGWGLVDRIEPVEPVEPAAPAPAH
jgi:enoyl-CoA hydratase/carnithine racemase